MYAKRAGLVFLTFLSSKKKVKHEENMKKNNMHFLSFDVPNM